MSSHIGELAALATAVLWTVSAWRSLRRATGSARWR